MAQQDRLFPLDPINTQLTAPVGPGQVAAQGPLDISLTTSTRSAGIRNFASALSTLAQVKQKQVIHNDIITAELAAAYEQSMPGGLQPEAQLAYTRAVDTRLQGQVIQQIKDFTRVEGSEILNDVSQDRLVRATNFKNRQLEILNLGKQSISQANASELFPAMEAAYREAIATGNVSLAADKQQEVLSTSSAAIGSSIRSQLNIANSLLPTVDAKGKDGKPLTAQEFVSQYNTNKASAAKAILSPSFFNKLVKETYKQNLGTNILDIKAVTFANFTQELIKMAQTNPEVVNEQIIQNILDTVQGQTKGSTLQSDMTADTDFGKVIKTIYNNFNTQLKTTLDKIEDDKKAALEESDLDIANLVQDNIDSYTEEEAIALAKGIRNDSKQRAVEEYITKHFKEGPKLGLTSQAAIDLGFLVSKGVFQNEDGSLDRLRVMQSGAIYNLSDSAIKHIADKFDPEKALGRKRKALFDNQVIKTNIKRFRTDAKELLKSKAFGELAEFYGNIDIKDPMQVAMFKKMLGKADISDQVLNILQAEVEYAAFLENLVEANPDAPLKELIAEASQEFASKLKALVSPVLPEAEEPKGKLKETDRSDLIIDGSQFAMEPIAASGTTTFIKPPIPTPIVKQSAFKRLFNQEPRAPMDVAEIIIQEQQAVKQTNEDRKKLLGLAPAPTSEKIGLIQKYGGIPSKVIDNRYEDSPVSEIRKVRRMVELMQKDKIEENIAKGNNLIRIGNFQVTVDEFNTFNDKVENFIWTPLKNFFNQIRVHPKEPSPDVTTKPKFEKESFEDIDPETDITVPTGTITGFDETTNELVDFIIAREGFSEEAEDVEAKVGKSKGIITSGHGLTDTGRKLGEKVDRDTARVELVNHIEEKVVPRLQRIEQTLPKPLTENQKIALISLLMNVSNPRFEDSKALKALQAGDESTFMEEAFSKQKGWVKVDKKFVQGLFNRRQEEKKLWTKK